MNGGNLNRTSLIVVVPTTSSQAMFYKIIRSVCSYSICHCPLIRLRVSQHKFVKAMVWVFDFDLPSFLLYLCRNLEFLNYSHFVVMICLCSLLDFNRQVKVTETRVIDVVSVEGVALAFFKANPVRDSLLWSTFFMVPIIP